MSIELLNELEAFVQVTNAARFSRDLRHMMIVFMQTDTAKEAFYTNDVLAGLESAFSLLDVIAEEQKE